MSDERDPERIAPFIAELVRAWKAHPDWRFGQLVRNSMPPGNDDPFYVEDDEMLRGLRARIPAALGEDGDR